MGYTIRTFPAFAGAALILAGCAGDSAKYPSLAIRDVERVNGQFQTAPPPVAPVELEIESNAPSNDVAALVSRAKASHSDFLARAPSVTRLVNAARGAGRDSEIRGRAMVALADLSSLRSKTEIPLGDLDLLVAERTNRLKPEGDATSAHDEVRALVNQQDRVIANLWRILGQ